MKKTGNGYLGLIFLVLAFTWVKSGWGKVSSGVFPENLGKTLLKFADSNPYPWFKTLLTDIAVPNSVAIGWLVQLGELTAAVLTGFSAAALIFKIKIPRAAQIFFGAGFSLAAVLNATFWLASGWTSGSTDSLNLVMMAIEIVGVIYWFKEA